MKEPFAGPARVVLTVSMHPRRPNVKAAFSLIELLVVMAIILVLTGMLLPALDRGKARAQRIQCVNNLKQLGLCFHAFAHDNNSAFPNSVLPQGFAEPTPAVTHLGGSFYCTPEPFKMLGNEMPSVRLLICPTDSRYPASNLASLRTENLSYFVNTQASYRIPTSIIAGDRNLRLDEAHAKRLQLERGRDVLTWTAEMHRNAGNMLFSDGSVRTERRPIMISTERWGTNIISPGTTAHEPPVAPPPSANPESGSNARPASTQRGQAIPPPLRGGSEVLITRTGAVRQVFVPPRIHGLEGSATAEIPAGPAAELSHTSARVLISHTSSVPAQAIPAIDTGFVSAPLVAKSRNSLWILYVLLFLLLIGLVVCLFRARSTRSGFN